MDLNASRPTKVKRWLSGGQFSLETCLPSCDDFLAGLAEACSYATSHGLCLLGRKYAPHSCLESGLPNRRALLAEVLAVQGPDLAPKPGPHLLHRVQVRRRGGHAPDLDPSCLRGSDIRARVQERFVVTEDVP